MPANSVYGSEAALIRNNDYGDMRPGCFAEMFTDAAPSLRSASFRYYITGQV